MKISFSILFISLMIFIVPAMAEDQEALQMPARFLGGWEPHNLGVNISMDIKQNIITHTLHKKDGTFFVSHRDEYKIVHINDKYIYIIAKEYTTLDYLIEIFDWSQDYIKSNQKRVKDYLKPDFEYRRYSIRPYIHNQEEQTNLIIKNDHSCGLTEKDWNFSAHIHWKRLESGYCRTLPDGHNGFTGHTTWTTEYERRALSSK